MFLGRNIFSYMKRLTCYYDARGLANILNSMAKIQRSLTGSLFELIRKDHIEMIHNEGTSKNISGHVVNSKVGCRNDTLFITDGSKLSPAVKRLFVEGNRQNIANLL